MKTRGIDQRISIGVILGAEEDGRCEDSLETLDNSPIMATVGSEAEEIEHLKGSVKLDGAAFLLDGESGYLLTRNRNCSLFTTRHSVHNWILSILMGGTWMGGVAIYGMAVSKLGRFGPSIGWALIQSTAIMAGNAKGLITGEWRNTSNQFRRRMIAGLLTLFGGIATVALSTLV